MSLSLPSDAQLDALREVANIGCGHAANALSRLMGGRQVDLSVPRVLLAGPEDAAGMLGGDAPAVAAWLSITGALRGVMMLGLSQADGQSLETLLLGGETSGQEERDSAVSEAANIVASACLSAIGKLTSWRLMPSVPTLRRGSARVLVEAAVSQVEGDASRVVVLEARFMASSTPSVSGQLLLVLERESSRALLARLGV
ncbi:fibril biogenesis regulator DifG [Myxococcus stipitatus DSM 14675]|uniref:Fibril biogenesis regulator DifG n=1 Tax=Myxococcus stipitatus (strain DSM 14675 / JCM 12634 / Mx s8) TaxID=1278073 RepID=L7UKM0_MYXSD|nr:chemotaxis protein CheC [Myxococcus stipitatus]AGC48573.1 fibril biogenesis regulator DifG [Myxococcus stipitatus DSM 14675]